MPALLFCIKALQAAVVSFVEAGWSQGVGGFIPLYPDVLTLQLMLRYSLGFMRSGLKAS